MNRSTGFRNKLIYLSILIAMLIPLYLLGQPADGSSGDAGGQLTQMRTKFNIAESELGDINPASETMKFASLGLRGVAATLLWNKAHDYRTYHEWDRLKATLNNIALLQPHYEKVWEFQAHNLSYNVSSEFDDYRQRYAMVREGTEYLTKGVEQNRKAPRLVWYTGWFYGQKLGMSDEKRQFRRLFADDVNHHEALREHDIDVDSPEARGADQKPDNWLVGRLWLFHGYDLVDNGVKIRNQTPINFFETGPKWRIKHAEAIESEGVLDDRAKNAWLQAGDDWDTFGKRSIPTTAAFTIKLGSLEELNRQLEETTAEFVSICGETIEAEKKALFDSLSDKDREAWETKPEQRTEAQHATAAQVAYRLDPPFATVARKAPPAVRLKAIDLAAKKTDLEARIQKTDGHRKQINYEYWLTLTKAEQEDRTVQARRLLSEAEKANADANLPEAIAKYEQSFELWAKVFDDFPVLTLDDLSDDLMRSIRRYSILTDKEEFAEDFPLLDFVQLMSNENRSAEEYDRLRKIQIEKLKAKEEEAIKAEVEETPRVSAPSNEGTPEAAAPDQSKPVAPETTASAPDAPETTASAPDAPAPDAPAPDAPAPDAPAPDAPAPDAPAPDAPAPDAPAPDAPAPDAPAPDAPAPDAPAPDAPAPDAPAPDAPAPDAPAPDAPAPDAPAPDAPAPDAPAPDAPAPS